MFQLLAYGLLLSPAVFPAAPRPAVAGAPTITQLQQRDNGIFVSWTADTVWDYYIVTYSLHNPRQGQASDRTPGGMQGADTIQPLPPYGTEVDVTVQGAMFGQNGGSDVLSQPSVQRSITVISLITVNPSTSLPKRKVLVRPH